MSLGKNQGIRVPAPNEAHPGVITAIRQIISELGLESSPTFGDLVVSGDITIGDDLVVTDDVSVGGNLSVTGNVAIDGDITSVDAIQFDLTAGETPAVGKIHWNATDGTLDLGMVGGNAVQQVGMETYVRVCNKSGSVIGDGKLVYIDTAIGGRPTIKLADTVGTITSRKVAGFTTESIGIDAEGYVTAIGYVRGLDTSSFNVGDVLFADPDNPGDLINTIPGDGNYIIGAGICLVSDASDGVIFVSTPNTFRPIEITDVTGFPEQNEASSASTISFTDGTRTFSIQPTATDFRFYQGSIKFISTGDTVVIDASGAEGSWYFYYDLGVLTAIQNPTQGQIDDLIRNKALVAYGYWDEDNDTMIFLADERHGINMSSHTHAYLHFTVGAQWVSGLALTDIVSDDTGSSDSHAQFGAATGVTTDEDLINVNAAVTSTTGLPIYYLDGANGYTRKTSESGFSVLTDDTAGVGTTGRLVYNEWTGATWQLSVVDNLDFVLCHVFATNSADDPIIAFIGQGEYNTAPQARAAAESELASIITNFPAPEIVPIATLIFQTRDTYSNSVKARVISTDSGDDYVDWRQTTITGTGASPSDHGNLTGLTGTDHHTQYALLAGRTGGQTLIGSDTTAENLTLQDNSVDGNTVVIDGGNVVLENDRAIKIDDSGGTPYNALLRYSDDTLFLDNLITGKEIHIRSGASSGTLLNISNTEVHSDDLLFKISSGSDYSVQGANYLRSVNTGDYYIDNYTTGQDLVFRVSDAAAIDTTVMTLTSDGIVSIPKGQVKFPATQNASSDANTLDDYEEGTWTPGVEFGGATTGITYTTQDGKYTKIGNLVSFSGWVALSNKGTATGNARITGLPFTNSTQYSACSLRLDSVSFVDFPQAYVQFSDTDIVLNEVTNAGSLTQLTDTDFSNGSAIMVAGHYHI